MKVECKEFSKSKIDEISKLEFGSNWPVVYLITNEKEAYIGETLNAKLRTLQHLDNIKRQTLRQIYFFTNEDFNKSVIIDLESFLIKYMSADNKYKLQNGNAGIKNHNYYEKARYQEVFHKLWNTLKEMKLVDKSLEEIENSDLFKYSPYKVLNMDQLMAIKKIIYTLQEVFKVESKNKTIIIQGGAGTGKTVIAVYLIKLIVSMMENEIDLDDIDIEDKELLDNLNLISNLKKIKFAFVIPMQSLRDTLKNVFKNIKGLEKVKILSPNEVPKNDDFDLLIVDEAHRLRQRKALANYVPFDKNNKLLNLNNNGTELDWIIKKSKVQIFFYDALQSIKPSDVDREKFDELLKNQENIKLFLESQLRCKGGNDYIEYIRNIIKGNNSENIKKIDFNDYDVRFYENIEPMYHEIREKELKYGLCRMVAGYSWKWKSKINPKEWDISIEGNFYRWNGVATDWINTSNSINEIGCIHTVQGYDLNYVGVIFGNEIDYDFKDKKIIINKKMYYDQTGKTSIKNEEELVDYIKRIYITLMTRGIRGTFIYACNENMKKYLKQFFNTVEKN